MKEKIIVYCPTLPPHLSRQTPTSNSEWGRYRFIFSDSEPYDYLVICEDGSERTFISRVSKKNTLLFLGEPPYVRRYNKKYLSQFGQIYGCLKSNLPSVTQGPPCLPWFIGDNVKSDDKDKRVCLNYDDFKRLEISEEGRKDKVCVITSNKKSTIGHKRRVCFVDKILKRYPDLIDVYGNGYRPIGDKYDVLSKYKYSLVIENCQYPNYWTEKLADTYLAGCYPIYYGCPNINDYFDDGAYSLVDINDFNASCNIIKSVVENKIFSESIRDIEKAKRQILDDYNMFNMIALAIDKLVSKDNNDINDIKSCDCYELKPSRLTISEKVKQIVARKYGIL